MIYVWAKQQRTCKGKENNKLFCYGKARDLICHTVTWPVVLGWNNLVIYLEECQLPHCGCYVWKSLVWIFWVLMDVKSW